METAFQTLNVIMPVYNEERIIEKVLNEWKLLLDELKINYQLHVFNDGSIDHTAFVLQKVAENFPRLILHQQRNMGHGPTLVRAYRHLGQESEWVLQVDSDDEISPHYFKELWRNRYEADFLLGYRHNDPRPMIRRGISRFTWLLLNVLFMRSGKTAKDINCPFRLMKCKSFLPIWMSLPLDTFAPNVLVSAYAAWKGIKTWQLPLVFKERTTGEVSIRKWKLFRAVMRALKQTLTFWWRRESLLFRN